MTILFFFGFFILLFIIGLLWILVPALYGLPPVPTNQERIRKARGKLKWVGNLDVMRRDR